MNPSKTLQATLADTDTHEVSDHVRGKSTPHLMSILSSPNRLLAPITGNQNSGVIGDFCIPTISTFAIDKANELPIKGLMSGDSRSSMVPCTKAISKSELALVCYVCNHQTDDFEHQLRPRSPPLRRRTPATIPRPKAGALTSAKKSLRERILCNRTEPSFARLHRNLGCISASKTPVSESRRTISIPKNHTVSIQHYETEITPPSNYPMGSAHANDSTTKNLARLISQGVSA